MQPGTGFPTTDNVDRNSSADASMPQPNAFASAAAAQSPSADPPQRAATKRSHSASRAPPNASSPEADGATAVPAKRSRPDASLLAAQRKVFVYGNYDRYYGYRNRPSLVIGALADFADIRLDAFRGHARLFDAADCLDIGCNRGAVSLAVARHLGVRSLLGIDIDRGLIAGARQRLAAEQKRAASGSAGYPHNVYFKHANYVLNDAALLDLERPTYDTILCLSVTKWIHLNFGDDGLRLAFRRMFRQLRHGGRLIVEAQPWSSYKRRRRLTPDIERNFRDIRMQPAEFEAYLLGPDVGFASCWRMEAPRQHASAGFRRPIVVFEKSLLPADGQQQPPALPTA